MFNVKIIIMTFLYYNNIIPSDSETYLFKPAEEQTLALLLHLLH